MRLVCLTLAWLFGIWLGQLAWSAGLFGCGSPRWPLAAGALLLLLSLPAVYLLRARLPAARYLPLALFFVLGAWRYQLQPLAACPGLADVSFYQGQDGTFAVIEGVVNAYPDVRDTHSHYRLEADRLTLAGQTHAVRGAVLVQLPRDPAWHYGDRLRVAGMLEAPTSFENFDYPAYLARQGIYSVQRRARAELLASGQASPLYAALYRLRDAGREVLNRALPEPTAALANGILLGIESGIPADLNQSFKDTSTSHIIVISGSNVALLSGLLLAILGRWFGLRRVALPIVAAIGLYVLLTGAGAASVRAGLMGALYVAAIIFGRQSTPLVLLAASALCMTAMDPRTAWDTGFRLSILATLGLILFAPGLQARLNGWLDAHLPAHVAHNVAGLLGDTVVVTVAAQALTLPLTVYEFGRISLIGLVANFLILPAQPAILVSGLAMLAAGLIWLPLARLVAPLPWLLLTYTAEVVRGLARAPLAAVDAGAWGRPVALLAYFALAGVLALRWLADRGRLAGVPLPVRGRAREVAILLAGLAVPAVLLGGSLGSRPDGRLHLYFLPAPGAEAALLVTPGGNSVFFWDGRGDGNALATAVQARLPGGRRGPDLIVGAGAPGRWAATSRINPADLASGQILLIERGVSLEQLPAGSDWAMLLKYGEFAALPRASLSQEGQVVLAGALDGRRLTVVKAPGPGTGMWPGDEFLRIACPQILLWPKDTTYPPATAAALAGLDSVRVEPDAVIEVVTDGSGLWLRQWSETERR